MYQRECPEAKSHGVGGAPTVARKATATRASERSPLDNNAQCLQAQTAIKREISYFTMRLSYF